MNHSPLMLPNYQAIGPKTYLINIPVPCGAIVGPDNRTYAGTKQIPVLHIKNSYGLMEPKDRCKDCGYPEELCDYYEQAAPGH